MKNRSTWHRLWLTPCLALAMMLLGQTVANAVPIIGLTLDNHLVRFDSTAPGTIISSVPITGLRTGEVIHGIDFRPAICQLIGVGSTGRLYHIIPATGAAIEINSTPFSPALVGNYFGVDFNPVVDRVRVVSDRDQNLRLNPETGAVAGVDTPLAYAAGDPHEGTDPNVSAAAYTNNLRGATRTTLYGIDYVLDTLVRIGGLNSAPPSPNSGLLTTVGSLGVNASNFNGFDIAEGSGIAYAAFRGTGGLSRLYTIALGTGHATLVGTIPGSSLRGLAVVPIDADMYAVTVSNRLLTFRSSAPGTILSNVAITGLQPNENIRGIDFRPSTGALYALGSTNRLYIIAGGVAHEVGSGPFSPSPIGFNFGFDFNPVADRIRVVSDIEQNLRLNPDDGTLAGVDSPLAYAAGDAHAGADPNVVAAAYKDSFTGAGTTTLYGIDTNLDILVRQGGIDGNPSPNTGELHTIGNLGVDATGTPAFDIGFSCVFRDELPFAAITGPGGVTRLYLVNLANGRVSQIGVIGVKEAIVGLSVSFFTAAR